MAPALRFLSLLLAIALAAAPAQAQNDAFDYGDTALTAVELYDAALKHAYGLDGHPRSRQAAISRLKKAAAENHAPSLNLLGVLHLEGNGLFASPRKALRSFEQAAALGDAIGQYNAGYSYLVGRGSRPDLAAAERYFLQVVDDSLPRTASPEDFAAIRRAKASAYLYLGLIYGDEDEAAFHDEKKAADMLHRSDALNEPGAAMLLAIRYARGLGVEQDQAKSGEFLRRYKLAAVNQLHNSFSQNFFHGMDREDIRRDIDAIVSGYEDRMTKRIQDMQTNFGVSLLDEEDLYSPAQAFLWLEPVAGPDNPLASSRLAVLLYYGDGAPQDHARARELLEMSYKLNSMAKYNLAVMLAAGQGGLADPERAAKLARQAAQDGWYPAVHYGENLADAPVVSERDALALVKEESGRNPDAMFCYGRRFLFGVGVERDFAVAKNLILSAADQGHVQARYYYGVYIASDMKLLWEATEEDKAIQAAADAGYPPAIHFQGQKAEDSRKFDAALKAYRRAAELEHAPALYKLGKFYREGLGVAQDLAKAVSYFQAAADMENAVGMLNLGLAYEYGRGVPADPQKAYELYRESSALGSAYADYLLGNLLASGKLGAEAWEEAIPYWETAADYRVHPAFLRLGDAYFHGRGAERSLPLARNFYYQAVQLFGYPTDDTTYRLCQLYLEPDSEDYNPQKALGDLRLLEIGGYPLAGYQLGLMNMRGIALRQNAKKALAKLLKTAESLGSDLRQGLGSRFSEFYRSQTELRHSEPPSSFEDEQLRQAAADACFQIAFILFSDELRKSDPDDGALWLAVAARAGHAKAQFQLGKLYLNGKYANATDRSAWDWILESAKSLDEAKLYAGEKYFAGEYAELGEQRAVALLRQAAAAGSEKAASLLRDRSIPLDPENVDPAAAPRPQNDAPDDGIDGPIDLDLA